MRKTDDSEDERVSDANTSYDDEQVHEILMKWALEHPKLVEEMSEEVEKEKERKKQEEEAERICKEEEEKQCEREKKEKEEKQQQMQWEQFEKMISTMPSEKVKNLFSTLATGSEEKKAENESSPENTESVSDSLKN